VSDFAGLLAPADRTAVDHRLGQLRHQTGDQFALVTLDSLEGGQIDDFAVKLFKKWGVGEKGKNNGVMLLVAVKDRKARIEVGYGLEPILPDALAGRVLDEELYPSFKQHRYSEGLRRAVDRIAEILDRGEPAPPQARQGKVPTAWDIVAAVLSLSFFVAIGFSFLGAGVGGRQVVLIIPGLVFGGMAMYMAYTTAPSGLVFGILAVVGLAFFAAGWAGARRGRLTKPATRGWASGWTWGSSGDGFSGGGFSSGGFSDGGFSGGGGGFGGGCSGGGGASGSW
jgi:uncharacterized protein